MPLSEADAARLITLRTERDRRLSGGGVQSVSSSGRSVTYSKESMETLTSEIEKLEAADAAGGAPSLRGAIQFRF